MVKQTRHYMIILLILIGALLVSGCKGSQDEQLPTPFY